MAGVFCDSEIIIFISYYNFSNASSIISQESPNVNANAILLFYCYFPSSHISTSGLTLLPVTSSIAANKSFAWATPYLRLL